LTAARQEPGLAVHLTKEAYSIDGCEAGTRDFLYSNRRIGSGGSPSI